jgi:hypothetical protein
MNDSTRFNMPSAMPAVAMPVPPTIAGRLRAALRAMNPAMIAGKPVNGPRQSRMPHTSATTAAMLAGGLSPRGKPVLGSIVMACRAMVSGEPVIGFGGA